jgi:D-3-phosphoglycerate dehydrogenase
MKVTTKVKKVLITTVPFGDKNKMPLDMLKSNNIEYVINPLNKKLTENELKGLISDFITPQQIKTII